jgi:hypothetical protein
VAVDEGLLGVEPARGDRNRGVPRLLHAHVLGLGGAGTESDPVAIDLDVVGDVALRTVRHDLRQPDLTTGGGLHRRRGSGDDARQLVDPLEAEVADGPGHRS